MISSESANDLVAVLQGGDAGLVRDGHHLGPLVALDGTLTVV